MGYLIDDKKFINDNIFKYEERMNSQFSRFLDKTPTFVTYYNINTIESTADNGFQDIEKVLGENSPIRFKKINDFPVYGLDPILLDLNDDDMGLNSSFEGEVIVLPNTIQPLPNDFFTISYLDQNYLFMVTEIKYDTIKSNNYYKITFTLKSMTPDNVYNLELQTQEIYNCVMRNIGTQEKCLIREDDLQQIMKLNDIYRTIADKYKVLFYNNKYNSFMFETYDIKLYDKYLTYFINKNMLFNERYEYNTMFLTNEDITSKFPFEYENCIYRNIEKQKKPTANPINYNPLYIQNSTSIFTFYRDVNVKSVSFINGTTPYINPELLTRIVSGEKLVDEGIIPSLVIDYFNDKISSIYGIDTVKLSEYEYTDYTLDNFILIPVLLFIIHFYYNKFMAIN